MGPTASQSTAPTALTAEQLLLRVLDLIKATRSSKELTIERVSAAMQHPAQTFSPGHFGYGGKLTPEWSYWLEVKESGGTGTRLDLDFIDTTPGQSAAATDICQLDFSRFSSELKAAGFVHETYPGEHGRVAYEQFNRNGLGIIVDNIGEASVPADKAKHTCVRHVTVQ